MFIYNEGPMICGPCIEMYVLCNLINPEYLNCWTLTVGWSRHEISILGSCSNEWLNANSDSSNKQLGKTDALFFLW
jgi:hypothetical protein